MPGKSINRNNRNIAAIDNQHCAYVPLPPLSHPRPVPLLCCQCLIPAPWERTLPRFCPSTTVYSEQVAQVKTCAASRTSAAVSFYMPSDSVCSAVPARRLCSAWAQCSWGRSGFCSAGRVAVATSVRRQGPVAVGECGHRRPGCRVGRRRTAQEAWPTCCHAKAHCSH